jgi:hypothetical protein
LFFEDNTVPIGGNDEPLTYSLRQLDVMLMPGSEALFERPNPAVAVLDIEGVRLLCCKGGGSPNMPSVTDVLRPPPDAGCDFFFMPTADIAEYFGLYETHEGARSLLL